MVTTKDSFYYFNPNWHIVGITYDSLEEIKEKYSEQFLKYTYSQSQT